MTSHCAYLTQGLSPHRVRFHLSPMMIFATAQIVISSPSISRTYTPGPIAGPQKWASLSLLTPPGIFSRFSLNIKNPSHRCIISQFKFHKGKTYLACFGFSQPHPSWLFFAPAWTGQIKISRWTWAGVWDTFWPRSLQECVHLVAGDQEPVCQYLVSGGANANCFVYICPNQFLFWYVSIDLPLGSASKRIAFDKLCLANKSQADKTFRRRLHANPSRHIQQTENTGKTVTTLNSFPQKQCKNMTSHKTSQYRTMHYWILNRDWFKLAIASTLVLFTLCFLPVSYLCFVYLPAKPSRHCPVCPPVSQTREAPSTLNEKSDRPPALCGPSSCYWFQQRREQREKVLCPPRRHTWCFQIPEHAGVSTKRQKRKEAVSLCVRACVCVCVCVSVCAC